MHTQHQQHELRTMPDKANIGICKTQRTPHQHTKPRIVHSGSSRPLKDCALTACACACHFLQVTHYASDGWLLHKSSEEARKQLEQEKTEAEAAAKFQAEMDRALKEKVCSSCMLCWDSGYSVPQATSSS